jgi:hypothetical protein
MTTNPPALINGIPFPFNPNSVEWTYELNKASFDTVGGRVTQIISIKIGTVTWEGDSGSRENLLKLFKTFKAIQDSQINTETSSPLVIPSRQDFHMSVWLRNMEVAWDYQSVTYPYRIQFEVDEDFGAITSGLTSTVLDRISQSIGWNAAAAGVVQGKFDKNGKIVVNISGMGSVSVDTNINSAYNTEIANAANTEAAQGTAVAPDTSSSSSS